jgi:hypothetical protein
MAVKFLEIALIIQEVVECTQTNRRAGDFRFLGFDHAVALAQFSPFSQTPISLAATLACCSSLPIVKKPWNWPGKLR